MKAILYEMYISESTLDFVHGHYSTIKELFIPSWNMCFNSRGFAFKTDKSRYKKNNNRQPSPKKLKTINLDLKDATAIHNIVKQRNIINRLSEKHFNTKAFKDDDI